MADLEIIKKIFTNKKQTSSLDFKEIRKIFSPDKTTTKEAIEIRRIFTSK